jgi:hypothetical protein
MFDLPTTIDEINQFIQDQVQESLHLDYKDSRAIDNSKRSEIAKDVSAFANSDGGLIIYGVIEQSHLPERLDDGVDHTKYKREWLEQIINSNISPRIDDVQIAQIPLSPDKSIFAIKVPKTYRGPHQSYDKRYYKRFNFQSEPMEDYEINDVRNRRRIASPLVNVDIEIKRRTMIYFVISNIGEFSAEDVMFKFSEPLKWRYEEPSLFKRGTRHLPPKRTIRFFYNTFIVVCQPDTDVSSNFVVEVNYFHPGIGQRITDYFPIDLMDYKHSAVVDSEIYEHGIKLKEGLEKLTSEVNKLNSNIRQVLPIAGSTGLDISVSTLRNLKHLMAQDGQIEQLDPTRCDEGVFREVLNIDDELAYRIRNFYWYQNQGGNLEEIEGITDEVIEKIKIYFTAPQARKI